MPKTTQPTVKTVDNFNLYIVSLYSLLRLNSLNKLLNEFADLHYRYSDNIFKFKWLSKLWVKRKFLNNRQLIDNFKLGKIDSHEFIAQLLIIFSFLKDNPSIPNPAQLLKNVWNDFIDWDEAGTEKLSRLINFKKPVYFISNTNELYTKKIMGFFQENLPAIHWHSLPELANPIEETHIETTTTTTTTTRLPLEIAPNLYLYLSYHCGAFKTDKPGLIDQLTHYLTSQQANLNEMLLVSEYPDDLKTATKLGIPNKAAVEFYRTALENSKVSSTQLAIETHSDTLASAAESFTSLRQVETVDNFEVENPTITPMREKTQAARISFFLGTSSETSEAVQEQLTEQAPEQELLEQMQKSLTA